MGSRYNSYKKVSHLPLRRVLNYLHINEDGLYHLMSQWIDENRFSKDNPHFQELSRNRRRRLNEKKRELNEENYMSYQHLRQEGLPIEEIAEILERPLDRVERFDSRWYRELRSDDYSFDEILEETGIPEEELLQIQEAFETEIEEKKKQKQKQQRGNAEYARRYLEKIGPLEDLNEDFVIMDLEGVQNPDEILEVAVIDLQGNVLINTLVRPSHHISWHVSKLTGINDKLAATGRGLYPTMQRLQKILNGKTILTWGTDYDQVLLNTAKKNTKIDIDCEFACAQHIHMGMIGSSKQMALYKACDEEDQSHRALGDCRMVLKVLKEDIRNYYNSKEEDDGE